MPTPFQQAFIHPDETRVGSYTISFNHRSYDLIFPDKKSDSVNNGAYFTDFSGTKQRIFIIDLEGKGAFLHKDDHESDKLILFNIKMPNYKLGVAYPIADNGCLMLKNEPNFNVYCLPADDERMLDVGYGKTRTRLIPTYDIKTTLHTAAMRNDCSELNKKTVTPITLSNTYIGNTPLLCGVANSSVSFVLELLNYCSTKDVNAKSSYGNHANTSLILSVSKGWTHVATSGKEPSSQSVSQKNFLKKALLLMLSMHMGAQPFIMLVFIETRMPLKS